MEALPGHFVRVPRRRTQSKCSQGSFLGCLLRCSAGVAQAEAAGRPWDRKGWSSDARLRGSSIALQGVLSEKS